MTQERRYRANEARTLQFYQMPKILFGNSVYKGLSLGAKACYSILSDRQKLSEKNGWKDKEGFIYLMYSDKTLSELIECSEKTVRNFKKELIKFELLDMKRLGLGLPNMLYVLKPEIGILEDEPQPESLDDSKNGKYYRSGEDVDTTNNGKNYRSKTVKSTVPKRSNLPPNKTEFNKTELLNTTTNDEPKKKNCYETFFQAFGRFPTPLQSDAIGHYLDDGLSDGLLSYGFEKAGRVNANFLYAEKIFKDWLSRGIRSREEAEADDERFQNQKGRMNGESNKGHSGEAGDEGGLYW